MTAVIPGRMPTGSPLLNDLSAVPDDVVLVLGDYLVIEEGAVHDGMAVLLQHLPP